MFLNTFFPALVFLICAAILAAFSSAVTQMGRTRAKHAFKQHPHLFFFQHAFKAFFKEKTWEGLFFSLTSTKLLFQLLYAASGLLFASSIAPIKHLLLTQSPQEAIWSFASVFVVILIALFTDFFASLLSHTNPLYLFKILSPLASTLLLLISPLTWPLFKLLKLLFPTTFKEKTYSASFQMKEKLLDILHESEISSYFDLHDKKLLLSVAGFKDRIAREVMVPRIDVVSLSDKTTIKEAAKLFLEEGYSRIPVFHESVDHIIGVLLHKDLLSAYVKEQSVNEPINTLLKPVLYTPETKKLSLLLQEFRNKQSHLAIVVDEYGGTEGIVTIEDILEELVGEIADEYDYDEAALYTTLPSGEWIIDAKMAIIDIDEDLGIKIPQSSDYDTLGGYIFHRAGAIPTPGWRLHHDDFDLEVLSSTDRSVEKVRLTPHKT